jgi:hypothetical protein
MVLRGSVFGILEELEFAAAEFLSLRRRKKRKIEAAYRKFK